MKPALRQISQIILKKVVSGGNTPTAPSIVGTPQMAYNNGVGSPLTVTLTGVAVGDLIVVGFSTYAASNPPDAVVTAPGVTFSQVLASDVLVSTDLSFNAFTGVATAGGSLTITGAPGDYKGLVAFRVQNYDAAIFDGTPVAFDEYHGSGEVATIALPTTTYTHDLVLFFVGWYDSDRVITYDAGWPLVAGGTPTSNNGNSNQNQMVVLGKQVTTIGTYTPTFVSATLGTDFGGAAFVIKGKNV